MGWLKSIKNKVGGLIKSGTGRKGEQQAQGDITQGYDKAAEQISQKMPQARQQFTAGMNAAKTRYNAPEIVGSRQELYQRMLGKGGYSPETVNTMKGNAIETAGTTMRDVQNALGDRFGDSTGGGMAGENLTRAVTNIGAERARALRDVDIQNATLQEQQQSEAIPQLYSEANTLAELETKLGSGESALTAEEARLLAEIVAGKGAAMAGTRDTTNYLGAPLGEAAGAGIGAGIMSLFSTREVKTGIKSAGDPEHYLKIVKDMNICTYRYKEPLDDGRQHIGVIAEEAPVEIVTQNRKMVDLYDMLSVLTMAVQALIVKVEKMEAAK